MNFLQICQKTNQLVGLQGNVTSVVSASGYQKRLIDTVVTCWEDIQNYRKNWIFNTSDVEFTTTPDKAEYTTSDIFGTTVNPVREVYYILRGDNQALLQQISKTEYIIRDIENSDSNKVSLFTLDPVSNSIYLNPPNEAVTLHLYYSNNLQTLSLDTDVPICPSEFHNCITYKAASELALFFGSFDLASHLDTKYKYELGAMLRSQNPPLKVRIP